MLQLKDVTISYKNEPTVEHFNLNMKQGQIVSLVGESGSGKTTVIRAILGLLAGGGKVSEGSVLFENQDLLSYTNEQWRKLRGTQISMIFQDSGAMMNPTRKVGKVFTEYILTHEKISKKEAWAKEPTSALDVTTQAQIVRQMMELRDNYGTSIIVVTHNLGVAAYMSDYIVVMKNGKIEDEGTREHILHETENEYTKSLLNAVPSVGGERFV